MAKIIPYLNFNGKCREAMTFYHHCFGGELVMQKIAESPMAAKMPSEMGNHILQSTLTTDNITIMGSDMIGDKLIQGNEITLMAHCQNNTELMNFFAKLALGGTVKIPLHQSFWGAMYGELTDKYGINWMFNYSKY